MGLEPMTLQGWIPSLSVPLGDPLTNCMIGITKCSMHSPNPHLNMYPNNSVKHEVIWKRQITLSNTRYPNSQLHAILHISRDKSERVTQEQFENVDCEIRHFYCISAIFNAATPSTPLLDPRCLETSVQCCDHWPELSSHLEAWAPNWSKPKAHIFFREFVCCSQ